MSAVFPYSASLLIFKDLSVYFFHNSNLLRGKASIWPVIEFCPSGYRQSMSTGRDLCPNMQSNLSQLWQGCISPMLSTVAASCWSFRSYRHRLTDVDKVWLGLTYSSCPRANLWLVKVFIWTDPNYVFLHFSHRAVRHHENVRYRLGVQVISAQDQYRSRRQ